MGIIIVVEDEFITSEYLSGILTDKGYSVIAVANADNAIEMLELGMMFECLLPTSICRAR